MGEYPSRKHIIAMFSGGSYSEQWTNAFGDRFGERACIGIESTGYCFYNGKKFKPTDKELHALYREYWQSGEGYWLKKQAEEEVGTRK